MLTDAQKKEKLHRLVEVEGFDGVDEMFEQVSADSVAPAICCNPDNWGCDYTAEMEPDQDRGWCEECQKNTVQSAWVLAGFHLMRNARYIYALCGFTVEKRDKGWFFAPTQKRHDRGSFKGPYRSEASVTLMIARELRKELERRHESWAGAA